MSPLRTNFDLSCGDLSCTGTLFQDIARLNSKAFVYTLGKVKLSKHPDASRPLLLECLMGPALGKTLGGVLLEIERVPNSQNWIYIINLENRISQFHN